MLCLNVEQSVANLNLMHSKDRAHFVCKEFGNTHFNVVVKRTVTYRSLSFRNLRRPNYF